MDPTDLQACDILPDLLRVHPGRLPANVVRVRVVQNSEAVWLERTSRVGRPWLDEDPPVGSTTLVERDVLSGFIACGPRGELLFDPTTSVLDNAVELMRLTPYSLINVTNLFLEEEAYAVDEGYRNGGAAAADCWAVLAAALESIASELGRGESESARGGEPPLESGTSARNTHEQTLADALVALATLLASDNDDSTEGEVEQRICSFDEECLFPTPSRVQDYFREAVEHLLATSRTFPGLFDSPWRERVMELYDALDFSDLDCWPASGKGTDDWLMRGPTDGDGDEDPEGETP